MHVVRALGLALAGSLIACASGPPATELQLTEGEAVFRDVCSRCHTLGPPPNLAPPMRMVAMHLRQALTTREAVARHVVTYLPAPDAEQSVMPAHAIERFGLMPPQPLPTEMLESVAAYVWELGGDVAMPGMGGGPGRGPGAGTGPGHRHRGGGGG